MVLRGSVWVGGNSAAVVGVVIGAVVVAVAVAVAVAGWPTACSDVLLAASGWGFVL